VAAAAVAGFTLYQAAQARTALNSAAVSFEQLSGALAGGETARAREALYAAQEATASARRHTGGPVWWLASKTPVLGDDVTAVRTVTDVVDDLAGDVLPNLIDASEFLSPGDLQPSDGRIPLAGIERVAPQLADARESMRANAARVAELQPAGMVDSVAAPVRLLQDRLNDAVAVTDKAALAAQLLPPMLGGDGKRTYLVLFQNNAEIRATGGIPGAVALITADDGRIRLQRQGTAAALGSIYRRPVLPLTREELALFTEKLGVFPADITFTPDFPRTAQLGQEMWRRQTGQTVDGVLSTDPIALSYLLRGTGPVNVSPDQQLTAANAVDLLLNQIYLAQADAEVQNQFFAGAARSVFDAVAAGQGDPRTVFDGLVDATDDHRLLIWSDHSDEQALLASTGLAGGLPDEPSAGPDVGVYLNDGTGAKMDYYLDYETTVTAVSCDKEGAQTLKVGVTMTSEAPPDPGSLPVSVRGPGFGAPPGWIRTNVLVYAPFGGHITEPRIDGKRLISAELKHEGRRVAAQTVDLAPGQTRELSFDVTSGPGQPGQPDLRMTPGMPGNNGTVSASACG